MTSLCRVAAVARQVSSRSLYMSASCHKQIKHTETEQRIVVEGVMPAPAAPAPADSVSACGGGKHQCHPFCKSPIVNKVKHTDVLILDQFVDSKGEMYSMHDLKICTRQWSRLHKLVQMCQRAGLMPGKEFYCSDYRQTKWGSQNCYWDEKTIDIQWNRNQLGKKIREFKTGRFRNY